MLKVSINRACPALFLIILSLLLSGCQNGLFGLFGKGASSKADQAAVVDPIETQHEKDLPTTVPAPPVKAQEPLPVREEDDLLAQLVDLRNPEEFVPLSSLPRSAASPQREAGKGELAGSGSADFSYRNATLTEDIAWRGEVLVEGGVTIAPQTTLTVENGTVVRFRGISGSDANAALVVLGRIVVNGTVARPVTFTSTYRQPVAGDWQGIVITGSGKNNRIENCRVEGAVTGIDASFSTLNVKGAVFARCRTGARLQDTVAMIDGLEAGECGTGLILYDCEADLRSANFFGNRLGVYAARTSLSLTQSRFTGNNLLAVAAESSRISFSGNNFIANGSGLSLIGCEGAVSANSIARNAAYGILLKGSRVKVSANHIEGNGKAGLRTEDGKGVAWGNALFANGEFDLYNGGGEEFRAIGNWWGTGSADEIAARIYDRTADEGRGRVLFFPPLQTRPETATLK